ncbi:MAG TPA: beta-L-arabinofuranosidase domain-containing protein [Terracidiphilus sp.]|jgi:hypothetical protein
MSKSHIGRRDFLQGSIAAAATLRRTLVTSSEDPSREPLPFQASAGESKPFDAPEPLAEREKFFAPHAKFRELQLGSVLPEGWLKKELEKQVSGITRPQANFCFPFDRRYWASNERGQDEESRNGGTFWYPWEQTAYWADGAYRSARLAVDSHLRMQALEPIEYTVRNPIEGWFLGPQKLFGLPANQDPSRWPQAVFFRALAGAAEGENSQEILAAMCHHYLEDMGCDYQHGPFGPRDQVNIESILWCYGHSGEKLLLEKALGIWAKIPRAELDDLVRDQPSNMHGVTFAERSKLGALVFLYTGDSKPLAVSVAAMERVFKYHMLADGTPSTTEGLSGTTSIDGHETCDIVEFNLAWGYLLMATGEGKYGDRIERALFNAGMGAVRSDWTGVQYISCPNQLHIARNSCQVGHIGTAAALYGPNSDHRPKYRFVTACCAGNINRMLPGYVQRTWMQTSGGGLAAVLYGPCHVAAKVGASGQAVEIIEDTIYPFSDQINFEIRSRGPVEFPLFLRIPSWCSNPSLRINGTTHPLTLVVKGFATLERIHAPGDRITLELPSQTKAGRSPDGGMWLEKGPLVYSLRPEEEWTPITMPEFEITSPDYFPMWAVAARTPWNYALAIHESAAIEGQVNFRPRPGDPDLWKSPPVELEVEARRIPGWDLIRPGGNLSKWYMTPPLPESRAAAGPLEKISLVPLGSTHLRLTVFPVCKECS